MNMIRHQTVDQVLVSHDRPATSAARAQPRNNRHLCQWHAQLQSHGDAGGPIGPKCMPAGPHCRRCLLVVLPLPGAVRCGPFLHAHTMRHDIGTAVSLGIARRPTQQVQSALLCTCIPRVLRLHEAPMRLMIRLSRDHCTSEGSSKTLSTSHSMTGTAPRQRGRPSVRYGRAAETQSAIPRRCSMPDPRSPGSDR